MLSNPRGNILKRDEAAYVNGSGLFLYENGGICLFACKDQRCTRNERIRVVNESNRFHKREVVRAWPGRFSARELSGILSTCIFITFVIVAYSYLLG